MSSASGEIPYPRLKRRLFGYDRAAVDRLLEEVAASVSAARCECVELREQVEQYRDLERLLRDAVVTGHRAAEEVRAQAERESEAKLREAHTAALEIVRVAEDKRDHLQAEVHRLELRQSEMEASYRAFLFSALELLRHQEALAEMTTQFPPGPSPDGGVADTDGETRSGRGHGRAQPRGATPR